MVAAEAGSPVQNYQLLSVDNPQLHTDGVDKARKTEYKSRGRNIFSRELPPPPPPKHPVPDPKTPIVPLPPPPPTVAPLPVKFFGYGTVPNGSGRRAFFTDGEDIYILADSEPLLHRLRIFKICNAKLEDEEGSSRLRGTANPPGARAPPAPRTRAAFARQG